MKTFLKLLSVTVGGLMISSLAQAQTKIGVLVPDSGPGGLFGPSARQAAELAAEDINAAGGIGGAPIELVFADVGVPPAQAVQSVQRLWRGQGVEGFVGMHDSAVRAALTGQFKGEVPYVYTAVYEGGECAASTYVTGETPAQQLDPVIPWLSENKGASKWYLIGNDYNWPRDTNAVATGYIAGAGGEIVGEEYVPLGTSDFDASLVRIKASGADAILVTLVGGDSVGFNIAYSAFGLPEQALRVGTLIEENTLAGIGAANAAGLYSSMGYFANLPNDAAAAYVDRINATFGDQAAQPNGLGQSIYDGLVLLAAMGNAAGSMDADAIASVADGTSFSSPRGSAQLDGNHVAQSVYLADGSSGSFEVVASFDSVPHGVVCN